MAKPVKKIDLNQIKKKVQGILTLPKDIRRQALDDNQAMPPTLSREELESYPFVQALRQYSKHTEMGPFQLNHDFDHRGVGTISTILLHPTKFDKGNGKLHIGVVGSIIDEYSDDHRSAKGFSGHGGVNKVILVVGGRRNAFGLNLPEDTFNLPVETEAGKFTVYFRPALPPCEGHSLSEAFHRLAVEMKSQLEEKIVGYVNSRGNTLNFTQEKLEATVEHLLQAFCLSEEYTNFLSGQIQ